MFNSNAVEDTGDEPVLISINRQTLKKKSQESYKNELNNFLKEEYIE